MHHRQGSHRTTIVALILCEEQTSPQAYNPWQAGEVQEEPYRFTTTNPGGHMRDRETKLAQSAMRAPHNHRWSTWVRVSYF
jgi:hypothetical protein